MKNKRQLDVFMGRSLEAEEATTEPSRRPGIIIGLLENEKPTAEMVLLSFEPEGWIISRVLGESEIKIMEGQAQLLCKRCVEDGR